MDHPRISVILTNYNHAQFLPKAIEAILAQSYEALELVIVDDASTDNSFSLIEDHARRDHRIRAFRNERNMGCEYSVRRLVELARGEFIYSAAADDRILPGFIEKSMAALAEYPDAALCCTDPVYFNEENGTRQEVRLCWADQTCYMSPEEFAENLAGGFIYGHTSVLKRKALIELGGFLPELKWHCDWFAGLVLAFRYGICYIPEPLAAMRESSGSFSASGRRKWDDQKKVLQHILSLLKSPAYQDVLPHFVRGSAMSHFSDEIVRLVMSEPQLWDNATMMLIQEPLWSWVSKLKQKERERWQKATLIKAQSRAANLLEEGHRRMSEGLTEAAYKVFESVTQEFTKLPHGYCGLAHAAIALRKVAEARDALTKASQMVSGDVDLLNQIGTAYFKLGENSLAIQAFRRIVEIAPANLDAHNNLAVISRALGRVEESLQHYEAALLHHPDDVNLLVDFGKLALETNRPGPAARAFARALELKPDRSDISDWLRRARSAQATGPKMIEPASLRIT
jgi:glycosyltransferase involved in cell wall biosynthesis/Tfp pilus assembly protein PilF